VSLARIERYNSSAVPGFAWVQDIFLVYISKVGHESSEMPNQAEAKPIEAFYQRNL